MERRGLPDSGGTGIPGMSTNSSWAIQFDATSQPQEGSGLEEIEPRLERERMQTAKNRARAAQEKWLERRTTTALCQGKAISTQKFAAKYNCPGKALWKSFHRWAETVTGLPRVMQVFSNRDESSSIAFGRWLYPQCKNTYRKLGGKTPLPVTIQIRTRQ
jgi:hypothetical protein